MKEETRENIIAILIVVALIGVILVWIFNPFSSEEAAADAPRVFVDIQGAPLKGDPEAAITVVEFSDFQCAFCARFALDEFPQELIDDGTINFAFRHFPLSQIHPQAQRAATAAACAERQDAFWEYHDMLFANQNALEIGNLQSYAEDIGLDIDQFNQCFLNELTLQEVLQEKQQGIALGVSGTPTFFFNGRRVIGFLTKEEFLAEVEKEKS